MLRTALATVIGAVIVFGALAGCSTDPVPSPPAPAVQTAPAVVAPPTTTKVTPPPVATPKPKPVVKPKPKATTQKRKTVAPKDDGYPSGGAESLRREREANKSSGETQFEYGCQQGYITEGC